MKENDLQSLIVITVLSSLLCYAIYSVAVMPPRKASDTPAKKTTGKVIKASIKKEDVKVKTLEELMPKFDIVTNSESSYQVRFKAYNSTNWTCMPTVFSNSVSAQWTIALAEVELEVRYRIMKGIVDDLKSINP